MASIRITSTIRSRLISAILAHAFKEREEANKKQHREISKRVYDELVPRAQQVNSRMLLLSI
jgi:hypothetical protein